MRLIKMFGLAALAATALMAFVGATSASAVTTLEKVVICKNHNTTPCSSSFASGTVLHGELTGGNAVLLSSLGNIECKNSTVLGTTNSALAHGEITATTFTNCSLGEESCTVTMEHLNYLVKGELASDDTKYELLITEKGTNGKPQAHVVCGFFVNCSFGANTILFEGLLNETDEVFDVLQELERSGGLCPSTSTWHAKYLVRCLEKLTVEGKEVFDLVGCWLRME